MKSIKKLLAVILALTFVMGLGTVGVQAKDVMLYQNYGCTVDFNGYTISNNNNYGYLSNADSDYSARILNNTTNNIAIAEAEGPDESNALKFASNTEGSKGNLLFYYNDSQEVTDPIKISFSIRFDATSGLPFYFYYRSASAIKMVEWSENKVKFAGKEITTYENDKWYDVELIINPTEKYGRYSMKETGTEQWSDYDVFSADSTIITSITGAKRLYFGFEGNSASTGNAYLDNISASLPTAQEAMLPLSVYNDNFEGDSGYFTSGLSGADWTKSWYIGTSSVSNTALSGVAGKVMNVATNATQSSAVYSSAEKRVDFAATPSLIHHFKFKLGGTLDEGKKQFLLKVGEKTPSVIYIQNEKVYINSVEVGAFAQENKLYDCEVIFDDSTDIVYAAITDSNGKRYSSVFATNASSYLQRIVFQNMSTVNYITNMYVDDFEWDVYEKNQLTFDSAVLKSGANDSANLDDEVSFTYQGASIRHNAKVSVTKDGTAVDASKYTVTAKNNVYTISFNELEKGGNYTVTLSGVKSLFNEEIAENSITFTAASTGITATTPAVADNTASTKVTSYYSKGKNVCLLVALYDASGRITEVVTTTALADARDGETVSVDLSTKTYETAKAFIWSELSKLVPIEIAQ